jgi:hypothetical protein
LSSQGSTVAVQSLRLHRSSLLFFDTFSSCIFLSSLLFTGGTVLGPLRPRAVGIFHRFIHAALLEILQETVCPFKKKKKNKQETVCGFSAEDNTHLSGLS